MYQPRQQIGRTASTYMPSWANEGRNIPIPGLSFYPILPLSMEREIKLAGDKRRANEKAIAALKKRGNRRFVGGMAQGIADTNPEIAIQYPENLSSNPNEINRSEIINEIGKFANRIRRETYLPKEEKIKMLRIMDLNRFYLSEKFPDEAFKTSNTFFGPSKKGGLDLKTHWQEAKAKEGDLKTKIYANTNKTKGLLWRIRAGEKSSVEKGILNPESWDSQAVQIEERNKEIAEQRRQVIEDQEEAPIEQEEPPIGDLEEFDDPYWPPWKIVPGQRGKILYSDEKVPVRVSKKRPLIAN
jgi:hypothetical protein